MSASPTPIGIAGCLDIDAADDGTVMGLGASGELLRRDTESGGWYAVAGWPVLAQLSVGSIDEVWGLDADGQVHRSSPPNGSTPVAGHLRCVSVGADGAAWAVGAGAEVLRYRADDGSWDPVPAPVPMRRIAAADADHVVALDDVGCVHALSGDGGWLSRGGDFVDLSIGSDGAICAVTAGGQVSIHLGEEAGWYELMAGLHTVAIGSIGNIWGLDADGRPVDLPDGRDLFAEVGHSHDPNRLGWDAQDPFDDTRSTHLWIVNHAARLAALDLNPVGRQIFQLVRPGEGRIGDPFHDQLCQGLYDADWVDQYRGPKIAGLQPSYAGHFYDPDTKLNWLGTDYNTALTNNRDYANAAWAAMFALDDQGHPRIRPEADRGQAGYDLGLALHYLTDLTQPMHSSNFTQASSHPNFMYHGAVETYAMDHQARVQPPTYESPGAGPHGAACPLRAGDSCGVVCANLELYSHSTAVHSKGTYAKSLIDVAGSRYYGWDQDPTYWTKVVDPLLDRMLSDAILSTAQFLVAWMEGVKRGTDYNDGYDPRWSLTQGYLTDVSVAVDGSVWGIGRQYPADGDNIFRWSGSGWEAVAGHLTSIAVGSRNQVWGVNAQQDPDADNVYHWTGSRWESVAGRLTSITSTSDGSVWGVDARQPNTQSNVYRWSGSQWVPQGGYLTSIDAAAGDEVWGVNTNPQRSTAMSNVFRWNGASWDLVGGKFLTGVSVADDKSVWGVDALQFARSDNVVNWNGRGWDVRSGFLTQVANGGSATVWGVNADHIYGNWPEPNIYRWTT